MANDENRDYPDQYMMRFPKGMRDELKAAAKANGRALNTEIIARLEAIPELARRINFLEMDGLELTAKNQSLEHSIQILEESLKASETKNTDLQKQIEDFRGYYKENRQWAYLFLLSLGDMIYDIINGSKDGHGIDIKDIEELQNRIISYTERFK